MDTDVPELFFPLLIYPRHGVFNQNNPEIPFACLVNGRARTVGEIAAADNQRVDMQSVEMIVQGGPKESPQRGL